MRRAIILALLVAAGCQKASDADPAKQRPNLPPPPAAPLPAALKITVEAQGGPAVIDAALLQRTRPDFEDAERRAWKLSTLLGAALEQPGAVAAVTGDKDVTVVLRPPRAPRDPVPVLAESRRGGLVAALVDPADPFPPYHGQGRRLSRPGDPLPRIPGVTRIRVYVEK